MNIREVNIHVAEKNLGSRFYNPRILWHRKQYVFIELITDDGFIGWGECWTFDKSADALVRFLQTEIRPGLIGRLATSIEDICRDLWSDTVLSGRHGMAAAAISGVDCALWDIAAKRDGQPVSVRISPGTWRRAIPVYASGGLYRKDEGCDELAEEMQAHVANGFRCVKMKIGALEFERDLERVKTVRQAIGPKTGLIIDAVYSLDKDKANRWLPYWKKLGVQAVQAPFPQRYWDDMRWLNRDAGVPVMVFEAENRYAVFRALLEIGAIGVMQFSPIAVGGISASLALIELAEKYGCQTSLQCSSSWLAEKIALQLGSARTSVAHVEIHAFHQYLFDRVGADEHALKEGCHVLADTCGLGFEVPDDDLTLCNDRLPDFGIRQSDKFTADPQPSSPQHQSEINGGT